MENKQKEKIYYGDYQLLGEMLDASSHAARMRYKRNEKEAVKVMNMIHENRKRLVRDYRKSLQID
ncbi:hypothetical protein OK18_01960 [Chryseobacterium gallinarum]|uniref:Uncharacterized protein n=1 Tax=Chryseobacterium gallinarum TaxID=1324352 RepID=A0A0G3M3I1_CHRGL|nr:hypothetical protein [Chryseobacterium gallinarum]AKK71567.1 hypothetical protein OK18_01960 [Chryseobacterium gallinarum]